MCSDASKPEGPQLNRAELSLCLAQNQVTLVGVFWCLKS